MTTPQDHYERLLAPRYSWMVGVPFDCKVEEQKGLLRAAGAGRPGVAADLGCGPGFQTVALVDLGATHVHAIDTSETLLRELGEHARGRPVTTHCLDLVDFDRVLDVPADTIVCMGDTLTHLAGPDDVGRLFGKAATALRPGGRLILSWRDLSSLPEGTDRFIPVRSTGERIMVCFVEDAGDRVQIHDLVHERTADGWEFRRSAYPKLRLPLDRIRAALLTSGLTPVFESTGSGMTVLAAVG